MTCIAAVLLTIILNTFLNDFILITPIRVGKGTVLSLSVCLQSFFVLKLP